MPNQDQSLKVQYYRKISDSLGRALPLSFLRPPLSAYIHAKLLCRDSLYRAWERLYILNVCPFSFLSFSLIAAAPAYHKLSWLTWSYIIRTYGGGPIVTSSMTPPPSSTR